MWRIDEALQSFRQPVIAAGGSARIVHALLNDGPLTVVGDDEAVEVEIETILHGRAVDLGDEAAHVAKRLSVETGAFSGQGQLSRRFPAVPAATAADMEA